MLLVALGFIIVALVSLSIFFILHLIRDEKKYELKTIELTHKLTETKTELLEEEQKFESVVKTGAAAKLIVAQMRNAIIFIGQHRTIEYINSAADSFLDIESPVGKPYQEAFDWKNEKGETDFSLFEVAFTGRAQSIPETHRLHTGRGSFPLSGTVTPIKQEKDGLIIGCALIFTDNTAQLEKISEEKAFFSTAAHELRSPITVIRAAVDTLKEMYDKLPRKDIDELLITTDETSVQLLNLVNDFLNVSRLEQGRLEAKRDTFDIIPLITEVVKEQQNVAKKKKLTLKFEKNAQLTQNVIADQSKSKEVLINLISNAIKYTIQGGITLKVRTQEKMVAIDVVDTGIGIAKDSQSLLFRRFQQIGYARGQSTSKSTGLGLYIAKKMAQLMKGDLVLTQSEPTEGSTFTFTLPRA